MGKTGKWIKNLFTAGKKEELKKGDSPISIGYPVLIQPHTARDTRRRWSFRRSTATRDSSNPMESVATTCIKEVQSMMNSQNESAEEKKHAMAMAAATDAALKAAQASSTEIHLTVVSTIESNLSITEKQDNSAQEFAAIKIQSVFRSYLARKALCALKGLVKLQALVRGHLVRKQANAALRCMQALVSVQARTRAHRILMAQESQPIAQKQLVHRKPPHPHLQENRVRQTYNTDMEENIKIVEMDVGELSSSTHRSSYSNKQTEMGDPRFSTYNSSHQDHSLHQISPSQSALTDISPRTCCGYFEDYSMNYEPNSPQASVSKLGTPLTDYQFFPSYMANTESSKAKVRSQSAPKQRPADSYERQLSNKQKVPTGGRNAPRAVKMQRSSSHMGSAVVEYRNPWSTKLDKSTVSLYSECGSSSTVLTNSNYCRSVVGYEFRGSRR
ncbi:hypothetical protein MKW98_030619 [Papaver atlanticum]|uniref:DUF4005 domain-containing protein n=1 Tax=Papaver atlanticum TaxID=357466 RepID=A0AAD4XGL4_9MAGN|nr:hypothetical protein MKW98_030619 [Papaver atlanticum]